MIELLYLKKKNSVPSKDYDSFYLSIFQKV